MRLIYWVDEIVEDITNYILLCNYDEWCVLGKYPGTNHLCYAGDTMSPDLTACYCSNWYRIISPELSCFVQSHTTPIFTEYNYTCNVLTSSRLNLFIPWSCIMIKSSERIAAWDLHDLSYTITASSVKLSWNRH